jgi:hypothetical protein
MSTTETKTILDFAQDTLETAEFGLRMVQSGNPALRKTGIRNLIVFGRAVTNTLQKLRSVVPDFESWYQPWVDRMRADPIMSYFYKLRSEILKEGKMKTGVSVQIEHLDMGALMAVVPRPPGAKSFFIGDQLGGSGWEVALPNGETQKFYVQFPQGIPGVQITVNLHLADAPPEIKDVPVQKLCEHYYSQLAALCQEAKQRFNAT